MTKIEEKIIAERHKFKTMEFFHKYWDNILVIDYEYVVIDNLLFYLAYASLDNNMASREVYKLGCISIYGEKEYYENHNVVDNRGMTLKNVIEYTQTHCNYNAQRLNKIEYVKPTEI